MSTDFGDFTLDDSRRQLFRAGAPIRVSPKAYQLLTILLKESPRAISKADIQEQLWAGTFVGEGSLATLITELRAALGDDAHEPRFIRTLYGFGYSFTAPLVKSAQPIASRRGVGHVTGAAAIGAVSMVLLLALRSSGGSQPIAQPQSIRSIAVLPFDTAGSDAADQHLGVGLPDLVISRLTNVRQLIVRPTSAIRQFAGHHGDSEDIGRRLKVDAVLDGSIRTTPDRVRVTVQLLNIRDQKPIWADRFDEKRTDLFALEDDISARVAEALTIRLTRQEKELLAKRYTSDAEAYQLYTLGRYHMRAIAARASDDETTQALDFLHRAVAKDPSFAPAWASLAQAYVIAGSLSKLPPSTAWPGAEAAARKAVQLDPNQAAAYAAIASVKESWDLDYPEAERQCLHAIDINPREPSALLWYAILLQDLGRFDESIVMSKRVIEVDPLSTSAQWRLANAYVTSGQLDLAMRQIQTVLAMDPNVLEARIGLSRVYMARGDYARAIAELRAVYSQNHDSRSLAFLGYALAKSGQTAEARTILQNIRTESRNGADFHCAVVSSGLGDREAVFSLLENALRERTYARRLKTEPVFEPYRSDPRFTTLLQRAGFSQ